MRKRHEPKGEGGSVGVVEINQKHLSTLLDRGLILSWAVASYPLNNADAPLCLLLLCLMADEMELSWERGAFVSSQTLYSSRVVRMTDCSIVERSFPSYATPSPSSPSKWSIFTGTLHRCPLGNRRDCFSLFPRVNYRVEFGWNRIRKSRWTR